MPFDVFLAEDHFHMNDWSYGCMARLLAASIVTATAPAIRKCAAIIRIWPHWLSNRHLMTPCHFRFESLSKTYASGFQALKGINLDINRSEIFALLGPNGAGKTTLISIICGIVNATEGAVSVDGHDIANDYRAARSMIGLVPQELTGCLQGRSGTP